MPDLFIAKGDLDPASHSGIDRALKTIQLVAKRIKRLSALLVDELTILDRLYYKGNNQHRAALFWRRVATLRRTARRASSIHIDDQLANLALAFHVQGSSSRSAWSQVPGNPTLSDFQHKAESSIYVLSKAQDASMRAYSILLSQIETAAFLPLAVSLSAIAARLRSIFEEICTNVRSAGTACTSIRDVITQAKINGSTPTQIPQIISPSQPGPPIRNADREEDSTTQVAVPDRPPETVLKTRVAQAARKEKKPRDAIDEIFGFD